LRAAAEKLPSSATAMNARSSRISISSSCPLAPSA
jgi:hypothetical protein